MGATMKLSDYLKGVGRPIAYYPGLRSITGSTTATIFICQFIYWTGKESAKDGWIYKTSADIEEETGLSYEEQKTARGKLVKAGLMEENYARLEHQMYFKVDLDKLNEEWGKLNPPVPEQGNATFGKAETTNSLISNTETTTENTATAEIFKTYENNISMLTPMLSQRIGDALDTYPAQWILDAIGEAVMHNARNWAYIEKILKTWKARGRANDKPLDKMSDVDKELLRMDIKPAHQVIEEMGLNDVSDEEQKIKNQKALAKIKETE